MITKFDSSYFGTVDMQNLGYKGGRRSTNGVSRNQN